MNRSQQEAFLTDHIPYRLRSVELLRVVCSLRLDNVSPQRVEILFDSKPFLTSNSIGLIANPFLEVGLMFGRVLLEFLGIKLDKQGQLVRRARRKTTDVVIEDLDDLQAVPVDALDQVPLAQADAIRRSVVSLIATSHKGVAHLTFDSTHRPTLQELHLGSQVVPWLVCEHVYRRLKREVPMYQLACLTTR